MGVRKNFQYLKYEHVIYSFEAHNLKILNMYFCEIFKGKVHPKNMLFSDVRSDKIRKNAVDRFSISPLVLKIFALKVEKLVIWRQPS